MIILLLKTTMFPFPAPNGRCHLVGRRLRPAPPLAMSYASRVDWQQHIERVPGVMVGKPVFKETRITVEFVLERLAHGARPEDLLRSHPPLRPEHLRAALAYAAWVIRQDELVDEMAATA